MGTAVADKKRDRPLWLINILLFAILTLSAVAYFFWQIRLARTEFLNHVQSHVRQVAEVIQSSAGSALASRRAAEALLESLLGNTARFVDYLNEIEPFVPEELSAFAAKSGLKGISISGPDGIVNGFQSNISWESVPCEKESRLNYKNGLYLFSWRRPHGPGCVVLGIEGHMIQTLYENLGLSHVVHTVSELPGIHSVSLEAIKEEPPQPSNTPSVSFKDIKGMKVAEAAVPLSSGLLRMSFDTDHLSRSIHRLWRDFFIFNAGLVLLGAVISLILYRFQKAHLNQVQRYERQIAAEHEDAALGRSAAAIAHEIRNPLNALAMGLQRLEWEAKELTSDHRQLLGLLRGAVKRADTSVNALLHYARPPMPNRRSVRLDALFQNLVKLYEPRMKELNISLKQHVTFRGAVLLDSELMTQVIENLLRNAMEAQPKGGFIEAIVGQKGDEACLMIRNSGLIPTKDKIHKICEPYFSTKAQGTGLGLTIAERIIKAHEGRLTITVPDPDTLEITVFLPIQNITKSVDHAKGGIDP